MKQILIAVIILIVGISAFYISLKQPSNTVKQPLKVSKQEVESTEHSAELTKQAHVTSVDPLAVNSPVSNNHNSQLSSQIILDNPAAQFDNLPIEMQEEIKRLSGRYNKDVHPIEIEPGVFMMPHDKGVRVVPVAVINEDGTVSTHEY